MEAIVAVYRDWGIGAEGTQPLTIPEDRQRFRNFTTGGTIVVGRKTLEDFPHGKPLKNRENIVLTKQAVTIEGATIASSVAEVLALVEGKEKVYLCGGASVYEQLLPYCDRVQVTFIDAIVQSDSFLANLDTDSNWKLQSESENFEHEGIKYSFREYAKEKGN